MPEDNFETLNNVDLRAKCLEYGLPNVPVTDSSRSLLIKRLRTVISASDTPTKKSNRRETIAVSRTYSSSTEDAKPAKTLISTTSKEQHDESSVAQRSNSRNRRTIAGTQIMDVSEAPNIVGTKEIVKPVVAKTVETASAPITVRRRSVREHIVQKVSAASDIQPSIIIESDDEEELILAAEKAERGNKSRPSSRAGSLSKTSVVTVSYPKIQDSILEERAVVSENIVYESVPKKINVQAKYNANIGQSETRETTGEAIERIRKIVDSSSHYKSQAQDQPNYYSPTWRRSTPTVAPTAAAALTSTTATTTKPSYYSKPYYHEQSDDTDVNSEEPFETPYLSNFTRNLERIKTEPINRRNTIFGSNVGSGGGGGNTDISQRYKRNTMYETSARRRTDNDSASFNAAVRKLWIDLDVKYHLKLTLIFLIIILFVIFLYVLFSP